MNGPTNDTGREMGGSASEHERAAEKLQQTLKGLQTQTNNSRRHRDTARPLHQRQKQNNRAGHSIMQPKKSTAAVSWIINIISLRQVYFRDFAVHATSSLANCMGPRHTPSCGRQHQLRARL